jgi:hypothetical protein
MRRLPFFALAFARGGMGSHHTSVTGGAFGTGAAVSGTNPLGSVLSSSGVGNGPIKRPLAPILPSTVKKPWSTR